MKDIFDGKKRIETKVHTHGFVALIDVMPRLVNDGQTLDSAIVQAARVSYGDGTKSPSDDRTLIRYLMRMRHTSPFEQVELKFHVKLPIFLARQWIRHRTANVNEVSARYSEMKDEFFVPLQDDVRGQGSTNKQVGAGEIDAEIAEDFGNSVAVTNDFCYEEYRDSLKNGVCREQARIVLPLSTYTEMYWKIDLHNLLHFLHLRLDSHAQQEIRDYAESMRDMIKPLAPHTWSAFEDYRTEAITLSRLEVQAIANGHALQSTNKREQQEFADKLERLKIKR